EARGEVIVVHLRRASVGLALTPENTHPFVEGEVTFSHNGQFDLSDQLRTRILARGGRAPVGTTDSELVLSLVTAWAAQLRPQDGRADWALAIQHAAAELTALTVELFGRPPESLNCLLTTPGTLVAFAQHDPAQAPADQPAEVYDLRWRADADRVLVSSTGYPQPGFVTLTTGAPLPAARRRYARPARGAHPAPRHAARRGAPSAAAARIIWGGCPLLLVWSDDRTAPPHPARRRPRRGHRHRLHGRRRHGGWRRG